MLNRSLVLLNAAAGYGKTSALLQAIDELPAGTAVAWIGCDEGDSPLQLFSCLVVALEPFDPPWRVSPEALLAVASTRAGVSEAARARWQMIGELLNALDACDVPHGVIVVDDLHRIQHPDVFDFIGGLLDRFTLRWTLVLATRESPPPQLGLARLRVRGEVDELRASDLRMEPEQVQALAMRAGVDASMSERLVARTAGWPAGLQLALNTLQQHADPAEAPSMAGGVIDRPMFEFLASEVIDRLPPARRDFLRSTCILPELTAARCSALSGDAHAAEHLEAIERSGLFVTILPGPEPTLRLHDLFRDALEQHLRREKPESVRLLLERSARTEPDPHRRLGYWLRAEAWTDAASELRLQAPQWLTDSQTAVVEGWLARFPPQQTAGLPDLLLVRALLSWMRWHWTPMGQCARAAAAAYRAEGRPLDALAADAYLAVALLGNGDRSELPALRERLRHEVETLLAERSSQMAAGQRWDSHEPGMLAALIFRLGEVWGRHATGCLDAVAPAYQDVLDLMAHLRGTDATFQCMPRQSSIGLPGMHRPLMRFVRQAQAEIGDEPSQLSLIVKATEGAALLWSGRVEQGQARLREAAGEVRWYDFPMRGVLHAYTFLCAADVLRGDTDALRADVEMLASALEHPNAASSGTLRIATERVQLDRWLFAAGLHDEAAATWRLLLADTAPWADGEEPWILGIARALLLWAEGRQVQALPSLDALLAPGAAELEVMGLGTELRLRAAALALNQGLGAAKVAPWLREILARHENDADLAAVRLAGPEVLATLASAPDEGQWSDDVRARLQAWASRARALRSAGAGDWAASARRDSDGRAAGPASSVDQDPPLTPRELAVLERLAAGDGNKLIARALDLSPHTVKRHVANTLEKLGLRSRGQAAAWYHERRPRPAAPVSAATSTTRP